MTDTTASKLSWRSHSGCGSAAPRVALLIPALNEEAVIESTLAGLPWASLEEVVVVDNGSTDQTAAKAAASGATVVSAPRRGYGSACLAGQTYLAHRATGPPNIVVYMDADGSDDADDFDRLVGPILREESEFVVGSRLAGTAESGALTGPQRFGNWLATRLIDQLFGMRFTDLGPFRAIRWDRLLELKMADLNYGWTVEMQIKAAKIGLPTTEIPVSYRVRQGGQSKVSGTVRGSVLAGIKILLTIAKYVGPQHE